MAYKIKQVPQDFIVEELMDLKLDKSGSYSYFMLEKKEMTTPKAISLISERLNIDEKYINFAGAKDKQAITKQYISINACNASVRKDFAFNEMTLKYLGQGNDRLNLGTNSGNKFTITVRNLDPKKDKKEIILDKSINYFDEQRFSKNNVKIARLILKRKFKEACNTIDEPCVSAYLEKRPNDYVGALKSMNKKILLIYIHAFQSKIWNDVAGQLVFESEKSTRKVRYSDGVFVFPKDKDSAKGKDKPYSKISVKNQKIPLVGFGTELTGKIGKIIEKILEENEVTQRDFILREIPGLSEDGQDRDLIIEVKDFKMAYSDDELNSGKTKCKLEFNLPSGSYATIIVKTLFG